MTKAEVTKTKEVFKSILMYVDEAKKTRLTKEYIDSIELNNIAIIEASKVGRKPLTKKGIQSLVKNPKAFSEKLKELIKDKFQFPNATDDFNLNSMGINYSNLNTAIEKIKENDYIYLITDDSKLHPEPKQLKLIEEQSKVFTKSDKQNKVLKVAKDLQKSANALLDLKVTYSDTQHHIGKCTNQLVKWGSNSTIQIDYHKILSF